MENWVIYTAIYALLMGLFVCSKKKAIVKNSIYEVLAMFSTISFIFISFTSKNAFVIDLIYIIPIFIKALVITASWALSLYVIKIMPISLYSVVKLSRIIFSILMSILFLGEALTLPIFVGMLMVLLGLYLVNTITPKKEKKENSSKAIWLLILACFLSSVSSIIDKKILVYVTSSQLQFWFLMFLSILSWGLLLSRKKKINFKDMKNNYWILLTAICLVLGDRVLFIANEIEESKVSVMTLIKQLSTIETIILGKLWFKEKDIVKKLLCSIIIIIGIVLTIV